MSYTGFLMSLYIAIFAVTWLVFVYAFPLRKLVATRMLMLLTFSFCVISFCTMNVYVSHDFALKILFSRLRFLGLPLLGPCWLLFLSSVFDRWLWLQKKSTLCLIFLPSAVTILLTLFPPLQNLVLTDFQPFTLDGLSVVTFQGGAWFPFHIIFSYLTVALSFVLGGSIFVAGNAQQRSQILILMFGCFLSAGIDVYCVITDSPMRWMMLSAGTFILNEVAIVYALFKYRLLDIAPIAAEQIFQDIPDPILVVDFHGFLRTANHSAKNIFGLGSPAFGKELGEILPGLNQEGTELTLTAPDGVRFFSVKRESLKSDQSHPAGTILSFRETTLQKQNEKRLIEDLDFRARLLAVIAHDLSGNIKNQALLSNLLQDRVSPEYKAHISMLQNSALASSDLMANILAWAKSQEAQFVPQKKRFEMNALIRECLELLETTLELGGLQVEFANDRNPLIVDGDSEMIACVARNLLSNSIRASRPGKTIYIQTETDARSAIVKIRDEGAGMSSEQCQNLMKSSGQFFFDQKEFKSGYGIGLKIAQRFIQLHQGDFFIESIVGVGTTVCFRIPV
jgi:signal transduction histidine kinase